MTQAGPLRQERALPRGASTSLAPTLARNAPPGSNLVQSEINIESLFRQAGVIRADTLEEMFDVAVLLANQPLPRGNRVAIISNSGGVLTICADACDARGLTLAGPGLVDLGALAGIAAYEAAVQQAAKHPDVDALIVIFACIGNCDPQAVGGGSGAAFCAGSRRRAAFQSRLSFV